VLIPRLVNVLGSDQWSEDVVPTVAFNLRQVRKGNVTMKVWDVAVCLSLSMIQDILHDTQELINRVNQNSEECGIDTVEEPMLYCMSPPIDMVYMLTNRYVVDAADVSFFYLMKMAAQANSTD
jgi:hypothetical protein